MTQSLWDFAVQIYAEPGIKEACLEVQNRHNGNVLVLIWLCWVAQNNLGLTDADIQSLTRFANNAAMQHIVPLRLLRTQPPEWLEQNCAEKFRTQVLKTELLMERCVLEQLETDSDIAHKNNRAKSLRNASRDTEVSGHGITTYLSALTPPISQATLSLVTQTLTQIQTNNP